MVASRVRKYNFSWAINATSSATLGCQMLPLLPRDLDHPGSQCSLEDYRCYQKPFHGFLLLSAHRKSGLSMLLLMLPGSAWHYHTETDTPAEALSVIWNILGSPSSHCVCEQLLYHQWIRVYSKGICLLWKLSMHAVGILWKPRHKWIRVAFNQSLQTPIE